MLQMRNFLTALVAVLAGNAIYFALVMPHLPFVAQHQIFKPDLGIAVAFVICLAVWLICLRVFRPTPRL